MLLSRNYWASRDFGIRFATDGEGAGGGKDGAKDESKTGDQSKDGSKGGDSSQSDDLDGIDGLGDKGKNAIRAARQERDTAKNELATLAATVKDLQKFKDDQEKASREASEEDAKNKGEFEKLATKYKGELDTAQADVKTLTGRIKDLEAAMAGDLEEQFKALPEEVQKLWKGDEADVLGKYKFVTDPDYKAIAKRLAGESQQEGDRGNGKNPPAGDKKVTDAQASQSQAPLYSAF